MLVLEMGYLERVLQLLRPMILSYSSIWDYCVVWKLGDDPTRFIELVDCCCNGGVNQEVGIKRKRNERNISVHACKDTKNAHPAETRSCEALDKLPQFMSLYSGCDHGEVVISSQPRWVNIAKPSDSDTSNEESVGTQVFIPVLGGLIELFSTKLIAQNESIIEYVMAQISSLETETMSNSTVSFDGHYVEPLPDRSTDSLSSLNQLHILPLTHIGQQYCEFIFGGSSLGSIPSSERPSPDSTPRSVTQSLAVSRVEEETTEGQKVEKKQCKSKNLWTERNRRKRINDGILILRSIVPKITKMHKAATLSDAVDYILELQDEKRKLLAELEEYDNSTHELRASCLERDIVEPSGLMGFNQERVSSSLTKRPRSQIQVEVDQLGNGTYFLRTESEQNHGAFTKLLDSLACLDLLVDNVNVTVCNGTLSSNIMVQTNKKEIQVNDLRDSLMQLNV